MFAAVNGEIFTKVLSFMLFQVSWNKTSWNKLPYFFSYKAGVSSLLKESQKSTSALDKKG